LDKKKLIGTIIGVVAFIALIAGATFAWFTATVTVTNGNYLGTVKNFVITYTGSSAVGSNLRIIDTVTTATPVAIKNGATSAATADDGWVQVTAAKTANDVAVANFKLRLHIETNNMATNSIVWVACLASNTNCKDTATNVLVTALNTSAATPTATCASGVTCGVIKAGQTTTRTNYGTNTDILLYNDTSTFNKTAAVTADTGTYNVYFWVDGPTVGNSDLGKGISGYVYAEAAQTAT
jgi:predicted ribosomally synthesized peptide with SipW-like signal peptide